MLRALEQTVGFAKGVVMSFDPDVLLPTAFGTTMQRGMEHALVACRNEQLDVDFLQFRDLARARSHVGVASRESDARVRLSPRWAQILDGQGHSHELRAALVDGSGQCWGALNLLRDAGSPFSEHDVRRVEGGIEHSARAIARSMVAGAGLRTPARKRAPSGSTRTGPSCSPARRPSDGSTSSARGRRRALPARS
jgi:hypothetical protein